MKKTTFLILTVLFITFFNQQVFAQYDYSEDLYYDHPFTYELGASVAGMNCFTDLGGKKGAGQNFYKDFNLQNSQLAGSVFFSTQYKYAIGLRAEATFGNVKAADNSLEDVKSTTFGRYDRNLSFKSSITEVMLALEIHPLFFKNYRDGRNIPRISPYLMGGIGFFSFNPKALLHGEWIELKPLHTEGQGFSEYPNKKPYKLKQLNFPVGVGIKYKASPMFNISAECVTRFLTTDYLDDVSSEYIDPKVFSNYLTGIQLEHALQLHDRQKELDPSHVTNPGWQRGNSGKNDSYFTFNLKMSFVF